MSERGYRAFAFTIRPKRGCKEENDKMWIEFIKRKNGTVGGFVASEKSGEERHLHCGIYFEHAITKSNFNKALEKKFSFIKTDEDSVKVLRGGTKIMYDSNFRTQYLSKEDTKFLWEVIPENEDEYYPGEEDKRFAKEGEIDSRMAKYVLWAHERNVNLGNSMNDKKEFVSGYDNCKQFLHDVWFVWKLEKAPYDDKLKRQVAKNLHRWENVGFVDW